MMTVIKLHIHSVLAMIGIALILFGTSTACSDSKGVQVSTSLTESTARDRIITYFAETLQSLPSGVRLSLTPDNRDLSVLDPGFTVPCNDRSGDTSGPVQEQILYWLVGVPAGQTSHYFALIRDIWAGKGYRLTSPPDAKPATVVTPEGYSLAVQDASKGDGSLSLSAGSPCFPENAKGTTTPQPTVIDRPA
ncbi:hypothetical protein [Nocardia sp. alder85J]|uniref:hypothetical protein n=1 Tax=Nocardia sp. alder85J TaxID=2862949 RepID=UPI001CD35144|nr:hypothetical protein [Nocardia sp. alder85J]MCX4095770.1 hypothetical protein [Nocardia sp. alder85J]